MPRGKIARTPENVALAHELREQGLVFREIAVRLGLSTSTVAEWFSDPEREKHATRRARYAGECVDCGRPTDGSRGPDRGSTRCASCYATYLHENPPVWGRDRLIQAIQAWVEEHGAPPAATDWNPTQARETGQLDRAERFYSDDAWPNVSTVQAYFGSWNDAIRAAGFEPNVSGRYGRIGDDPANQAEGVRLYLSGLSAAAVGKRFGLSGAAVLHWLKLVDVKPRPSGRPPARLVLTPKGHEILAELRDREAA